MINYLSSEPVAKRRKLKKSKEAVGNSSEERQSVEAKKTKLTFLEVLYGAKLMTEMESTIRCQAIAAITEHIQVTKIIIPSIMCSSVLLYFI